MPKEYKLISKKDKLNRLREIFLVFFKLGCLAFGGPAAHVAMMEDELVEKRKWLTRENLLDLISITHLIPGPNSTELALFVGLKYGGNIGLLLAGFAFIVPAMIITITFAIIYVTYGSLPQLEGVMLGIKPAIIVIILSALFRMGKLIITNREMIIFGGIVSITYLLGVSEFVLLFISGMAFALYKNMHLIKKKFMVIEPVSLWLIFSIFFKIGAILYGSGYVLLAFLEREVVAKHGLLTMTQLIDSIAVGEFTPGPVLTTSSFVGYLLNGLPGAVVATLGIFLPSFIVVLIINKSVVKFRDSSFFSGFLDGINVASIVLMGFVTFKLAINSIVSPITFVIFLVVFILKNKFKINSGILVVASGSLGYLFTLL